MKVRKEFEFGAIKYYNKKNQLHNDNGPAAVYPNGSEFWYQNDKLHREDGPAVKYLNGEKHWYRNGKLHREDGPAVEYSDGSKKWYINDEELTNVEFNLFLAKKKAKKNKLNKYKRNKI